MGRLAIHVLDDNSQRRAQIARAVLAMGHHAEVYADAEELADHAPEEGVVVALEDAVRDGISGLVATLNRRGRWLAIIATSTSPTIDKAVAAIKHGALDYLSLPMDLARLANALDSAAAEALLTRTSRAATITAQQLVARLSRREGEVMALVARGLMNKEAARELGLSPRTVEIHRTNAFTKLGARNTVQAIQLYMRSFS